MRLGLHRSRTASACIVGLLLTTTTALAWETRIRRAPQAWRIASSPDGGVFTVVPFPAPGYEGTVGIVKLSSRGRESWRRSLAGSAAKHSDEANGIVATADGDVVAAGALSTRDAVEFGVTRLAGRNGRPRWRQVVQGPPRAGSFHEALDVALDPAGDVIAAGEIEGSRTPERWTTDLAVVKLAGDSGVERWRVVIDGSAHEFDRAQRVVADAHGDVIVAGMIADDDLPFHTPTANILKLSGADGHVLWRTRVTSFMDLSALSLDADGAVLAAGTHGDADGPDFGVLALDGATGEARWTATLARDPAADGESAFGVTALPSGDVAAVGSTGEGFTGSFPSRAVFTVAAFDGATGAERWRRNITGSDGYGVASAVAVGPTGDLVVGGRLRNAVSCYDMAIIELAASSGDTLVTHSFDGSATATLCDVPEQEQGCDRCSRLTGHGIDQDALAGLTVDAQGRIAAIGILSDGRRGRSRAFVVQLAATGRRSSP